MSDKRQITKAQKALDAGRTVCLEEAFPSDEFVRVTFAFNKWNVRDSHSMYDILNKADEEEFINLLSDFHDENDRQAITAQIAFLPFAKGVREYSDRIRNPYIRSIAVGTELHFNGDMMDRLCKLYERPPVRLEQVKENVADEIAAMLTTPSAYIPDCAAYSGVASVRLWWRGGNGKWGYHSVDHPEYKPAYTPAKQINMGYSNNSTYKAPAPQITYDKDSDAVCAVKRAVSFDQLVVAAGEMNSVEYRSSSFDEKQRFSASICFQLLSENGLVINSHLRSAVGTYLNDSNNLPRINAAIKKSLLTP